MHEIREGPKTSISCGGRIGICRGHVTAVSVEAELSLLRVRADGVVGHIPAGIDDNVLPAKFLEILGHRFGVRANVGFAHSFGIRIPTVPTHRWSRCSGRFIFFSGQNHQVKHRGKEKCEERTRSTHQGAPDKTFCSHGAKRSGAEFAWHPRPSSRNRAREQTSSDEAAWGRGDAKLPDDPRWRSPCGARGRIAGRRRPTLPYAHPGVFSRGWKRRRWRCCARRL